MSPSPRSELGFWLNPWWRETHILESPRTPEECKALLIASTGRWWGKPILRSQWPGSDAIVLRRRLFSRSVWTLAAIRFVPSGAGTLLRIKLRNPYAMVCLFSVWIAGAFVLNLFFLFKQRSADLPFSLLALAAGFGVLALDRLLMRSDGPILLEFIEQTVDAQDNRLLSWPT